MPSPPLDPRSFASLAQELHGARSLTQTAEQVVTHAREVLGVDYAGITLMRSGGRLRTVAASAQLVIDVDRLQYDLNEGPCRDAAWQEHTLVSNDLANDSRWTNWGPKAAAMGIASVLSAELSKPDGRIGAINMYSAHLREFSDDDIAYANIFGQHAAVAIAASHEISNLNTALDARKVIGQAQGMLMERFELDEMQAFMVLKRYSQDNNIKLRTVAEQLVATRKLPSGTD